MTKKAKILMIEEERFLRKVYRNRLTKAGFDFVGATNGIEGLNKVVFEGPDLIILDLVLPQKNGFEVLRELKRNKNTRQIPVMILTNLGEKKEIEKAFGLGAKDFLIKTEVSLDEVLKKIEKYALSHL